MWVTLCRCFKFCWLKRNFPTSSKSSSSLACICILFFYLTFLTSYSLESQAVSHKRRHHHGDSRSNQLLSSIRSKRQHSPYGEDPYYSSYGYGAPDSGRQDTYPDTYVLDEFGQTEEEAGAWSEWSSPSECSRPCGGGVSAQSRQCLDRSPDGTEACTGARKRYFSCNIHDCPSGSGDYRSQQCSEFNEVPFEGRRYEWIPYTKAPNKCELNCMPRGERFYYRHKRRVTDGTKCNDENMDICVDGRCLPVGCDRKLGSTAREDKCRQCGGDGSNCNTITGIFDQNNMQVGYNDILLIPAGATNIHVRESRPSNNYLAIRNVSGHYYLNGNWRIDFPSEIPFAGTIFHYERKPHSFLLVPESIRALGPITEALYIVILYQESNPGIIYEYSIPKGVVVSETDEYIWTYGSFGPCDATCGGGHQTRQVSCARRSTMEPVAENLCDLTAKPESHQSCNNDPCPLRWYIGDWEACDAPCGGEGTQLRRVFCEQIVSGVSAVVPDGRCEEEVGPAPAKKQDCSGGTECPTWFVGEWLPCDHLCGDGEQKRVVKCHTHEDGKVIIHDDSRCREEKPEDSKPCFLTPCEGVDWVTSVWTGCDNCGATQASREVHCATAKGEIYPEEHCHSYRRPNDTQECEEVKACDNAWYAVQWSKCSSNCGPGVQTREVFCGESKADGTIAKVDEDKCDPAFKYETTQNCSGSAETCTGVWTAGPWSECSKTCGGGRRTRAIICMVGNATADVSKCDEEAILFGSEDCNKEPCGADEMMTVMPEHELAEDDYDEECDEDDYEDESTISMDTTPSAQDDILDGGSGSGESSLSALDLGLSTGFAELDMDTGKTSESLGTSESSISTSGDLTDSTVSPGFGSSSMSASSDSSMMTGSSVESSSVSPSLSSSSPSDSSSSSQGSSASAELGTVDAGESTTSAMDSTSSSLVSSSEGASSDAAAEDELISGTTEAAGSTTGGITSIDDLMESTTSASPSLSSSSEGVSSDAESTTVGITETTGVAEVTTTQAGTTGSEMSSASSESSVETTASSESSTSSEVTSESTTTESSSETPTGETSSATEASSAADKSTTEGGSTKGRTSEGSTAGDSQVTSDGTTIASSSTDGSSPSGSSSSISASDETTIPTAEDSHYADETGEAEPSLDYGIHDGPSSLISEANYTSTTGASTMEESTSSSAESSSSGSSPSAVTEGTGASSSAGSSPSDVTEETSSSGSSMSTVTEETGASSSSPSVSEGSTVDMSTGSSVTSSDLLSSAEDEELESESTILDYVFLSSTTGPETTVEMAVSKEQRAGKCKPRKVMKVNCTTTDFGCCPNNIDVAKGPFGAGCEIPKTCDKTKFGCCPDGVSVATGKRNRGCPLPNCEKTLFGCCPDGKHAAKGNDAEGCEEQKEHCEDTKFGCCPDGETPAQGRKKKGCLSLEDINCAKGKYGCCPEGKTAAKGDNYKGCKEINLSNCTASFFGCCADGKTAALGKNHEGCPEPCLTEPYGCCPDGRTAAHGPNKEGCCLNTRFGCCPDNIVAAQGPRLEGCGCQYTPHGCCPDNETAARGPGMEGCGCRFTEYGCCPDGYTDSPGPNNEGCPCQSFQFGCCPDGVTVAKGSNKEGCGCQYTEFGCCPDQRTPASGPNQENCGCEASRFGCCPDGITEARGQDFEGCEDVPIKPGDVCGLDKDRGSCRNFTVKWFFDMEYGGCSRFWYGGCDGNNNRFATQDECKAVCVEPEGRDACYLPRVQGPCEGYYPSWYYDPQRERCEQFIYGGCLGNNNRFQARELCENTCLLPDRVDACDQPKTEGPCRGNYSRWSFDKESESCQLFQYGGCKGNNNNFLTERECHQRCKEEGRVRAKLEQCSFPREPGPCNGDLVRWYWDENLKTCLKFLYGGCSGNPNRFVSRQECLNMCALMDPNAVVPETSELNQVCFQPKVEGPCGEKLARWHYDASEQRCIPFYYSGCQGNANKFLSLDECERTCPKALLAENACILPPSIGDCASYTERYHYDAYEGHCKAFVYSGCGGNNNNFLNVDECRSKCERPFAPRPTQVFHERHCFMEPDPGQCRDERSQESQDKWYYDSRDGVCRNFRYSGCEGNMNRFEDRQECEDKCSRSQDICQLPQVVGPCTGQFPQWYYDAGSDTCNLFVFSGCEGNGNRFDSQVQCEQRCKKDLEEPEGAPEYEPAYVPEAPYYPERRPPYEPETTTTTTTEHPRPEYGEHDICNLRVDAGRCADNREPVAAWYYDEFSGKCTAFAYSGCDGNANRFDTEEQCERQCGQFKGQDVCHMKADIGPCRARFAKWFFDPDEQSCRQFYYGGCHGNGNRFSTQEECESVCFARTEILPPNITISAAAICRLPRDEGPCPEEFQRFYYDPDQKTCIPFKYGGCAGNLNRFKNFEICIGFCSQFSPRDTRQNPDPGYGYGNGHEERPEEEDRGHDGHSMVDHQDVFVHPENGIHGADDGDDRSHHDPYHRPGTHHSPEENREPEPDCRREDYECQVIRCPYGVERYVSDGGAGCTRCRCADPCRDHACPEGTQCSIEVHSGPHGSSDGPVFRAVCRRVNKPGVCPNLIPSRAGNCEQECQTDADCAADMKCCYNGCGSSCLVPIQEETNEIPRRPVEPVAPSHPGEGEARIVRAEDYVEAEEGSLAALECVAVGNPEPSISWRKGSEKINVESGRFRLLADGTLQIIGVYSSDGDTYTCVADNGIGYPAQHNVRLNVTEPTARQAVVVEDNPTFVVSLGAPASLRCFAVGWPRPSVTWWRGDRMLPFSSERYEQLRDYSLLIRLVSLRDLGPYTCQAYNGMGKAASWTVTLQSIGPVITTHPDDQPYLRYLIAQPLPPVQPARPRPPPRIPPPVPPTTTERFTFPTTTTTLGPHYPPHIDENEIHVPDYIVPVRTTINLEKSVFSVGSDVNIPCEVEGYPIPRVLWYHEENLIPENGPRQRVLEDHTLVISNATTADSGTYRCDAVNDYGAASASVTIQVEGSYLHPNCTDNPFFANCKLIVKASYCTNRYYARFCCKSCTLAGQLPAHGIHLQEYGQAYFRRPPTAYVTRRQQQRLQRE